MIRRVVKVGGSLLQRKDLVRQVQRWIVDQPPAQNLFLFGGGDVVNSIRHLDKIHSLDAQLTHWVCIELLDASFTIASSWFGDWQPIRTPKEFQRLIDEAPKPANILVRCTSFYHRKQAAELPMDWRTTTDSIAARLATLSDTDELVLLKSCAVDSQLSYQSLVVQGIVDEAFPEAAKSIKSIRVEHLLSSL